MSGIVVGVDGSDGAAAALRWAAAEGHLRTWPVTAVLAWSYVDQHHPSRGKAFDPAYDESAACTALDAYLTAALGAEAAATIGRLVINDLPAPALLDAAGGADLLVVGARGLGGFRGLLLGSVSRHCLDHASGPVAVIRGEPDGRDAHDTPHADEADGAERRPRVVVGTDGSKVASAAVDWAADEARARHAVLRVLHAWQLPPIVPALDAMPSINPDVIATAADRTLRAAVTEADTTGLVVEMELAHEHPGTALVAATEPGDLLVVGRRGLGTVAGFLLGSTSQWVVHHNTGPVVVVPAG